MSIRIVLCNRKGGTGKTTTTVNLAAEMAVLGYRVLLLDLDSQSQCSLGLPIPETSSSPSLGIEKYLCQQEATLDQCIQSTGYNNLDIGCARGPFDHRQVTLTKDIFANSLNELDDCYDVVLIDTPPSLDALLVNALQVAHWVIVPFVPHHLSLVGIRQLTKVLYQVKMHGNPELQLKGLLPNMANPMIKHHQQTLENLQQQFGQERLLPAIRTDIKLAEAFSMGQSVRQYAPNSRASDDFRKLAGLLDQQLQQACIANEQVVA